MICKLTKTAKWVNLLIGKINKFRSLLLGLFMSTDTIFLSFTPSLFQSTLYVFVIDSLSFVVNLLCGKCWLLHLPMHMTAPFNSTHHTNDSFYNGILITKPNCNFLFIFKYMENDVPGDLTHLCRQLVLSEMPPT